MSNPILETYKHKATNTVYDLADSDARASISAIKDGTNIDSFSDVETALGNKADSSSLAAVATSGSYNDLSNTPTLGTAASKASTDTVTENSTSLVESGGVYTAIKNAFDNLGLYVDTEGYLCQSIN